MKRLSSSFLFPLFSPLFFSLLNSSSILSSPLQSSSLIFNLLPSSPTHESQRRIKTFHPHVQDQPWPYVAYGFGHGRGHGRGRHAGGLGLRAPGNFDRTDRVRRHAVKFE